MNILKNALTDNQKYLVATVFGFTLGLLVYTFYTSNYYSQKEPVFFDIKKGQTFNQVIDSLASQEIIPSKSNMYIAGLLNGADKKIKAGRFEIPNGLSYLELVELLLEGHHQEQVLVTIAEGIWLPNLAGLLKNKLDIDSNKFLALSTNASWLKKKKIYSNSVEGYLLPETYYFYKGSSAEDVLDKLYSESKKFFNRKYRRRLNELGWTMNELLTMASIIDGESNIQAEFAKISGVYHNRLKRGMKLQADPTVQYLIRHRKRINKIYYKDLEIDSPYNTYKHKGLPPTPINNPGKEAIIAALYPEEHKLLYFVTDGSGGHVFAKSYSEHQKNVRNYRRWRRSNR